MSKCKSKHTCSKNDCSAKHHTTLIQIFHEYFLSNQTDRSKKRRKEDPKQNLNIKRIQILPVKVKTIGGRTTTYALVDNGSQITLIRDGFVQGLKLKGYKKTISISSVIDEVHEIEEVKVKEVSLRIQGMKEENELHISALTLPKSMFNMPVQFVLEKTRINQLEYLKGIKIHNVSVSDIAILIRANAPAGIFTSNFDVCYVA